MGEVRIPQCGDDGELAYTYGHDVNTCEEHILCGHCGRRRKGYGYANRVYLCHPDVGMDCYRLVTIYRHTTPCVPCQHELKGRP